MVIGNLPLITGKCMVISFLYIQTSTFYSLQGFETGYSDRTNAVRKSSYESEKREGEVDT